eukprot:755829-Rhodomonas_salina.1
MQDPSQCGTGMHTTTADEQVRLEQIPRFSELLVIDQRPVRQGPGNTVEEPKAAPMVSATQT